jgi:hypothetical protein
VLSFLKIRLQKAFFMKKKGLVFITLFFTCTAIHAQVKWSANAGLVSTNNYLKDKLAGRPSFSSRSGFTVGGTMAFRLFAGLWSETGISFYQKGYRLRSAPVPDYNSDVKFRLDYLALNQNILVKVMGKKELSFSTGAGFFVAPLLGGRYVADYSTIIGQTHEEGGIKTGNASTDDFRSIDAGLNVLVRSQYKNIQLTMQYSPSFTTHVPSGYNNGDFKEKFSSISFTLGYEF